MQVRLYLLGTPRVEVAGTAIDVTLRKVLALVVYLAVTRQAHSRDRLATLLWPDKDQTTARANLRRTLHVVGQLLGEQVLAVEADKVGVQTEADLWLDSEQFARDVATCLPTLPVAAHALDPACLAVLVGAADLYQADFLAGFTLPDCPEFDEWQFFQREELRGMYGRVLARLGQAYEAQGDWEEALRYSRRLLALDPLDEAVQRRLMALYAQAGQMGAALRQYEASVRILADELDVLPEAETTALYAAIRARRFPATVQPSVQLSPPMRDLSEPTLVPPMSEASEHEAPHAALAPQFAHTFPSQATPFVGRHQELAELLRRLCDPACRLLTLVGPGGMGKTRLAVEVVQTILAQGEQEQRIPVAEIPLLRDGYCFVSLQPVSAPSGIVPAIAGALGVQFYQGAPLQQQLFQFLRDKELLLVLDNFEHLLDGAELVVELLAAASRMKLLITSREALKLQEEWFHPLAGMRLPHTVGPVQAAHAQELIAGADAVQLFVQTAQRAVVTFAPDAELEHIVRICRLVDGMPLGIELAASWLRVLPCAAIAAEIERSIDILVARHQNVPARHRSMRAVLEQSWVLLDTQEQHAFQRLSVFQGGFRADAAAQVAGASLPILARLVEKALVRTSSKGHYQMHELLRQFGAEQLQLTTVELEEARKRHCSYFLNLVYQKTKNLKGKQYEAAFAEISTNLDNVRVAWNYAADQRDVQALDAAAEGLWIYSDSRGTFQEAETVFQQAIQILIGRSSLTELPDEQQVLIGFMLAGQGYLCSRRGNTEQGRTYMDQGIKLLRTHEFDAQRKLAIALLYRGWLASALLQYEQATQLGQESMALFAALGDPWGRVASMELLSIVARHAGRLAEAVQLSQEGLALSTLAEAYKLRGGFLQKLGEMSILLGDYANAHKHLAAALEIATPIGSLPGMTQIQRDLARLEIRRGNYAQAIQMLEETQAHVQGSGYPWEIRVLPTLGAAYYLHGEPERAERAYDDCLRIVRASNNRLVMAVCLSGLGTLALDRGDCHQAEHLQQEALALLAGLGMQVEMAEVYAKLGHVLAYSDGSREPEARHYYRKALHLAITQRLAPIALEVFVGSALLLVARGDVQRAGELLIFVQDHPAATAETKQTARTYWLDLGPRSNE